MDYTSTWLSSSLVYSCPSVTFSPGCLLSGPGNTGMLTLCPLFALLISPLKQVSTCLCALPASSLLLSPCALTIDFSLSFFPPQGSPSLNLSISHSPSLSTYCPAKPFSFLRPSSFMSLPQESCAPHCLLRSPFQSFFVWEGQGLFSLHDSKLWRFHYRLPDTVNSLVPRSTINSI